jgi:hypothetical protein
MPSPALFDLAVNRARRYAEGVGLPLCDAGALSRGLEVWYLKTRFAYRVPLAAVVAALLTCPGEGYTWRGGPEGGWVKGPPRTP